MSLERPKKPEKSLPVLTAAAYNRLLNIRNPENDAVILTWMKKYGVEFDRGFVEVLIDGKLKKINTAVHDFGTEVVLRGVEPSPSVQRAMDRLEKQLQDQGERGGYRRRYLSGEEPK